MQGYFDFSETLIDADGDKVFVDIMTDPLKVIAMFLKCSKTKAREVYGLLSKEYQLYANPCQIILAQGGKVLYNFEMYGQTYYNGHKYNEVNEWDFRNFVDGKKIRTEKKNSVPKKIKITCTEMQLKRAAQLYYAHTIGFDINYKDYARFYLM